jgi:hypothetical protein
MEQLKSKLLELQEKKSELKKQIIEESQNVFKSGMSILFDKHPVLESFGWTQYTPYFMDGDTCYFGVNIDEPNINGESGYDLKGINKKIIKSYGTWNQDKKVYEGRVEVDNPDYNPNLESAVDDVREFLQMFDEDYFMDAFGDHMTITVYRNGSIDTDYYEHD